MFLTSFLGCGRASLRGKLEDDSGSFGALRVYPDASAHPLEQPAGDVEAEPGAADALQHLRIEAMELLEHALALGLRDSDSVVGNHEPDVAVMDGGAHANLPALG